MSIIGRFLAGFSKVQALYQVAVALHESRIVISSRYAGTPVASCRQPFAIAAGWKQALCYYRAAQRDEKNGFPLTAAMEWRQAAELSRFVPMARQCCWREWERIMHLPRRLASPLVEGGVMVFQDTSVSNRCKMLATVKDALSALERELGEEGAAITLEICWRNPDPPPKTKNSAQKAASKNDSAYPISRSNTEEEFELLNGAA